MLEYANKLIFAKDDEYSVKKEQGRGDLSEIWGSRGREDPTDKIQELWGGEGIANKGNRLLQLPEVGERLVHWKTQSV